VTGLFLFFLVGTIVYLTLKGRKKGPMAEAVVEGYNDSTAASSLLLATFLQTSPRTLGGGTILITRTALYAINIYTLIVFIASAVVAHRKRKRQRREDTIRRVLSSIEQNEE
jgi:cbb3-type cytochrome oxidase subunit 3